jgi:hypothetical protein
MRHVVTYKSLEADCILVRFAVPLPVNEKTILDLIDWAYDTDATKMQPFASLCMIPFCQKYSLRLSMPHREFIVQKGLGDALQPNSSMPCMPTDIQVPLLWVRITKF